MIFFEEATLRLKQQLKVTEDKQVAEALGINGKAFTARKRRDAFPEKELLALTARRPELLVDVDYVLTGKRSMAYSLAKLASAGQRVRQVREEAGLSIAEFATALGTQPDYVLRVEGADRWFANDLLTPIIETFKVPPMWLLSGELPAVEATLSPFEVFLVECYRLCGPAQRTALRTTAADLWSKTTPTVPAPAAAPVKATKPRVKKG